MRNEGERRKGGEGRGREEREMGEWKRDGIERKMEKKGEMDGGREGGKKKEETGRGEEK